MNRVNNNFKFSFLLLISMAVLILCNIVIFAEPVVVCGGPENDYESWLIRLNDGRLMVVFDRNPDWQSGDLYVSFSSDDGQTWAESEPVIVNTGDQATLSLMQMPGDTLRLWYASNESGAYKIYSAYSLDGLVWAVEEALNLGWSAGQNYYDPTVIIEPDSSLTMSYVAMGHGGCIAHCPYGGDWDTDRTLVGAGGYRARVMRHTDGTYLYAYHKRTGGQYDYDVFAQTSTDRINWSTPIQLTTNQNSHDPFPGQMPDGSYMIYYAKYQAPAYNLCCRRSFDAVNWEDEQQITYDPTNNTQPHFFIENEDIYLVWAHAVSYPYNHDVYFEKFSYQTDITNSNIENHLLPRIKISSFPNPFNTSTIIQYNLLKTSDVNIAIYDILGRKLETLISETQPAGNYHIIWDANGVSTGVYFYRLTAGDEAVSGRMMLLK